MASAATKIATDTKLALVATLPKSGTWYSHSFFWCYDQLLRHREAYLKGTFIPDLMGTLRDKKMRNKTSHADTLGIQDLFICHTTCPGFMESGDAMGHLWDALHFPLPSDWGATFMRHLRKWDLLNPAINPDARVVYLYRNPLDHFVSYYQHASNHVDEDHRFKSMPDGTRQPIKDLHDFVFDFGILGAFIKHYYSFRQMQARYPAQIKLMPYEDLMASPEKSFGEILSFMGAAPRDETEKKLFRDALALSSKKSMSDIEKKLGHSLSAAHTGGKTHIRDGKTGKWKDHFTRDELERIESVLNCFDISLAEFNLVAGEASTDCLPWLGTIDPTRKAQYQTQFFCGQLGFTGMRIAAMRQEMHLPRQIVKAIKSSGIAASARETYQRVRKNLRKKA